MANTTVSDLAKVVGTPTERLLQQMRDAGLPHKTPAQAVSDEDKKTLLAHLKTSHGESTAAPKKITLKRKTLSTLKTGAGKRTVSVEVRKKRTYVKRDDVVDTLVEPVESADALASPELGDTSVVDVPEHEPVLEASEPVQEIPAPVEETPAPVEETPEPVEETPAPVEETPEPVEETPEPVEEKPATVEEKPEPVEKLEQPEKETVTDTSDVEAVAAPEPAPKKQEAPPVVVERKEEFDPEKLRLAAAMRRRKAEQEAKQAHQEKLQAIKDAEKEVIRKREERQKAATAEKIAATEKPAKAKTEDEVKAKPKPKKEIRVNSDRPASPERQRKARTAGDADRRGAPKRGKRSMHTRAGGDHSLHINVKDEYEDVGSGRQMRRRRKTQSDLQKHAFEKPVEKKVIDVEIGEAISVSDLASKMSIKAGAVIKYLFSMGSMVTINQLLDQDTASLVIEEFGHSIKIVSENALEENVLDSLGDEGTPEPRPPVVTVMGHVDHGKTSLLDYIRNAKVASGEAGGITQHIGAYHVETSKGVISFLDTPGHAAFTAMRARGAQSTDIVILVVAADDGVMPQTEEAVKHAKAAGVPLIVAINKMDKEQADPERVKNELSAHDVIPEDWGGDVQFVPVSAHTGEGIEDLLDAISLQSELLELTAPRDVMSAGVVIESRLDKGRGSVASLMIQRGILRKGDIVLAGQNYGRVRAILDENGKQIEEAGPSIPVQILGLDGTPEAGDAYIVVENEKRAREVAGQRAVKTRESRHARQQAAKLDNMFSSMESGEVQTLNVVLKSDVRGSLEAIQSALLEQGNDEVKVNIVAGGVGGITESDMNLAITSGAVVFGFNVRADNSAKSTAETEGVDLRYYSVIYDLIDDVKLALSGMLAPELREEIVGIADVRETFRSPKFGQVAGCMVVEGTLYRSKPIRVLRDNVVIFQGELESLRRFKDDVNEVRNGIECGIGVKNYDVRVGDKIEVFETREIERQL